MNRSKFFANRLHEVLLEGQWIAGTNFKAQIESVYWEQAVRKVESFNSIAALTYHVNYYLAGILNVFNGGELEIHDQYSFDLPSIKSQADWEELIGEFIANAEKFIAAVDNLEDQKLDEVFVDQKYGSYLLNIQGVIEHSYYHLGQIALIKKLI